MSDVIDLIKKSYFYGSDEEIEKQIIDLVNIKCTKTSTAECIKEMINEIDVALKSDYVKETKKFYENKVIRIDEVRREIALHRDIKDELPVSFLDEIRYKFQEVNEVENQIDCITKLEKLNQIISCIYSTILLSDLELSAEEISNFISEISENEFQVDKIDLSILENFYSSYDLVKTELTIKFDECLKNINWPYITLGLEEISVEKYHDSMDEYSSELSNLFSQLKQIELPKQLRRPKDNEENMIPFQNPNSNENDEPFILWPVQLLLRKFVQYFGFYFCQPNQVNKLNKPEFYTNKILSWIGIHNPVIIRVFAVDYNVKLEFMRGFVLLVSNKIRSDLEIACSHDTLFHRKSNHFFNLSHDKLNASVSSSEKVGPSTSHYTNKEIETERILFHILEESLSLHAKLGRLCDYPISMDVLPQISDQLLIDEAPSFVFQHWVSVERRLIERQLDELFRSSTLWKPLPGKVKVKVECLVKISAILVSMKERITACHFRTCHPNSPTLLDISEDSDSLPHYSLLSSHTRNHLSVKSTDLLESMSDSSLSSAPFGVTDEYNKLWKLCQVLLEVVGDFRRRVIQVSKEASVGDKRWADVINVLYGICVLMDGWKLNPLFTSLFKFLRNHYKSVYNELITRPSSTSSIGSFIHNTATTQSPSIFSQQLMQTYHFLSILEGAWIDAVCEDVSNRLVDCCSVASRKGVFLTKGNGLGLTDESVESAQLIGAEPLLVLRDRLHQLHSYLESIVFRTMITQIAKKLDVCLLSRVIRQHRYSDYGANIMAKQIVAYIITAFLPYSSNPEKYFPESSEASTLLTLSWGTVSLLRDIIKRAYANVDVSHKVSINSSSSTPTITALKEAGVTILDPLLALSILEQRVDPELFRNYSST